MAIPETQDSEYNGLVLAILTVDDPERNFRGNRRNFIDLMEVGKNANVLVYVTTVHHLKLNASKVFGYIYNTETHSWERRFFPLPQVIYNRIPDREDEWSPDVRSKLDECLNHPTVHIFNPGFFNKWTLFKWLARNKRTRRFVPSTRKYSQQLNLAPMLRKYPFLYLKPVRGKAGMGIMRIRRNPDHRLKYAIDVQENAGNMVYTCATQTKLKEKIRECAQEEDYIVQQGIPLLSRNNRPFDLRVLVQKNRKGAWSVTGIGARQAGLLSITTHVPRGGTIENPKRLLTESLNKAKANRLLLYVRKAAIVIAKQIERASGNQLGELSLDLGVDHRARVWFFEANSKPMKFDEPHIRKKSLARLIHYSSYLARNRQTRH